MGQWPLLLAGLLVTEQNTEPQSLSRRRHDPGTRASHVISVSLTYTRVWAAARRLLAAPSGAGGGAGDGEPVRGADRVTNLTNQHSVAVSQSEAMLTMTAESPPGAEEMEKASVSWSRDFGNKNTIMIVSADLAGCVGDAAEAALMPHTDGVLLVTELQALTFL